MSIAKINEVTKANSKRVCGVVASSAAGGLLGIANINGALAQPSFSSDYSLQLNGTNQYVNLGTLTNSDLQPTQASMDNTGFTMACWIYIDTVSAGEYIFSIAGSGQSNYYGYKFVVGGQGPLVAHIFGLNGSTPGAGSNNRRSLRTANGSISAGQWYHVAWVIEAGSMEPTINTNDWGLFINGSKVTSGLVASGNVNTNLSYINASSIGATLRPSASALLDGLMNNAAVWNSDLSDANITAIYNSGTPIDLSTNAGNYTESSNLIAWWRFNEGTGTSYTDSSTNSFTGSGVNTPTWSTNTP